MQSVQTFPSLQNKRIVVGICGGVAAYKVPELVRRLKDAGAAVKVVMTDGAMEFITPLTLQAVSGERVHTALLDAEAEAGMGHIELARWADAIVVAPATADALARFASGRASDLLGTLLRASDGQVLLAPAMNQGMWRDLATQQNLQQLIDRSYQVVGPESGSQACGDVGYGRMSEPAQIAEAAASLFETTELSGKHVLITAGPTREPIDPVRYVSNHSSGKMGFALASAAVDAGARVTLVAGPVGESTPERVERIDVETAEDMLDAVMARANSADVFIASAAVADFRVARPGKQKFKKQDGEDHMTLELVKNPDILASVAALDGGPFTVGFAAETERVLEHATTKLQKKNLDMIVANDVSRQDIGFSSDHNEVSVISREQHGDVDVQTLARSRKQQLSRQIISILAVRLAHR